MKINNLAIQMETPLPIRQQGIGVQGGVRSSEGPGNLKSTTSKTETPRSTAGVDVYRPSVITKEDRPSDQAHLIQAMVNPSRSDQGWLVSPFARVSAEAVITGPHSSSGESLAEAAKPAGWSLPDPLNSLLDEFLQEN